MPDQSSTSRKQPKLRSSCDGCGMAKLRCDRTQPECGRCVSYGLPCVYGISRRMGKAPGRGRRTSVTQGTPTRQSGATETDKRESNNRGCNENNTAHSDAVMMDLGLLSNLADIPTSLEMADGNTDGMISSYLHEPSLLGLNTFDFDTKLVTDDYSNDLIPFDFQTGLDCTQESPEIADYSSTSASTMQPITIQTQADTNLQFDRDSIVSTTTAAHPCYTDAYGILRTLSRLRMSKDNSPGSSNTATMKNTNLVPFDHLLRINRETSERLSSLLDCACARSSHLTLLYASIICRVLNLYQQAAACTQGGGGLWNPTTATTTIDPSSHYLSPTWSSPEVVSASLGTGSSSTTWSGTDIATGGNTKYNSSTIAQPNNLTVTPAKMAVGVFNVDDQRVQTAVNIQLVLGEMRRTERLIDQFTTREFSSVQHLEDEEYTFGGATDNLCRSLESWLRAEHSRIVSIMRSQLRKLNT